MIGSFRTVSLEALASVDHHHGLAHIGFANEQCIKTCAHVSKAIPEAFEKRRNEARTWWND